MTDSTNKNTLFYTAVIFASVAMMALLFMKSCNEPQHQRTGNYDSLLFAHKVDTKLRGHEIAMLLKDLTDKDKANQQLRSELEAIKERDKVRAYTYAMKMQKLQQNAPVDCKPYIDSSIAHCDTIIMAKDSIIGMQTELIIAMDSARWKLDSIVSIQSEQIKADSVVIEKSVAEVTQANKKAHRAKVVSKVVAVIAAVAVVFSFGFAALN